MQELFVGMCEGHVAGILGPILECTPPGLIAVVRSLDSSATLNGLEKALGFHGIAYEVTRGNAFVRRDALIACLEQDVFTGFDEVLLFDGIPSIDLAGLPSATSDGTDFSSGPPDGMAEAMRSTGCSAVLGDGCGLNYATFDARIAEALRRYASGASAP